MTLSELLAGAETLSLSDLQQASVKLRSLYERRRKAWHDRLIEQADCDHAGSWVGTDSVHGEHYRRCTRCGVERTWLSDD